MTTYKILLTNILLFILSVSLVFLVTNNSNSVEPDEILQDKIAPIYKTLDGWQTSTFGIKEWKLLPKKAQEYIIFLENLINTKISIISTGPDRAETIDRKKILIKI